MTADWNERINEFWKSADRAEPDRVLSSMRALVEERHPDDPEAMFEWASAHDYLDQEAAAIPIYEAALAAGLAGDRHPQAIIQLASSLRNVGRPEAAVKLLQQQAAHPVTGDAAQGFLALALYDCGRHDAALQVALIALARTLPLYTRPIIQYANELANEAHPHRRDSPQPISFNASQPTDCAP